MWDTLVQYFWFINRIYFMQKSTLKPTNKRGWQKTWLIKDSSNKGVNYEFYQKFDGSLTLKQISGQYYHPLPAAVFQKNVFSKTNVKTCFLVTSNIITEIPQVIRKICRIYLSRLAIFIDFNQFSEFFDISFLQIN